MNIKTFLIIFCFSILTPFAIYGQNTNETKEIKETKENLKKQRITQVTKNVEGREFYICFMINFNEENVTNSKPLELQLFITSDYDTKVTIEFKKGNYVKDIFVKAGQIVAVRLDKFMQATLFEIEDVGQAIHIVSEKPISVYGLNRRKQTTDSFLAFPTEVLGNEYLIMSYYSFTTDMQSTFAVVATEDNTIVEIVPSTTTSQGSPAGKPIIVTLNKGNVYQVGCRNSSYSSSRATDLTGSYVKANKKIAVFGGHQCATIPTPLVSACNVLVEQIPPLNTWGKHFYVGALKSRSFYSYRVLASQDSTKVFEDTALVKILNRGEFIQRESRKNIQITADKPVLVAQYSQGSGNGDNIGDPMMILITPVQQYLKKYRFATPVDGEWLHFVNVFVPTTAIKSFKINGQPASSTVTFERFGATQYSMANIRLPYGSHTVECNQPFGLYSYGFGIQTVGFSNGPDAYDAYGAMGGQSFLDYEPVPDVTPPQAEAIVQNKKKSIRISDEGRDDTGLSDVFIIKEENMTVQLPNFTKGTPSILIGYQPNNSAAAGRIVFKAKDVANNNAYYTVCYVYDNTTNEFVTLVNKGDDAFCTSASTLVIGAFYSHSYNSYTADFTKTDNIEGNNNFHGSRGTNGICGVSLSRYLFSNFNVTAKLSLITNKATFFSADTNKYFVDIENSKNMLPYFTEKEINIKNTALNIDLGLDWKLSEYIYLSGGIAMNLNVSKTADVYDKLILPPGYEFIGGGTSKLIADRLNSLSTVNFGVYLGPEAVCNVGHGFQVFAAAHYYIFFPSILNDADLFLNKFNIKVGLKYQL